MNSTPRSPLVPAVFLDRDGVLVRDTAPVSSIEQIELIPGVPEALTRLRNAGYRLVVVTNQAIIARGELTEEEVVSLQRHIEARIARAGGPSLDGFYYCPHHPNADLAAYRADCSCRKPRPGLLQRAAAELGLDLAASIMVGDRTTDIEAGRRAGCRTVWVQSGAHREVRIVTSDPADPSIVPDAVCKDLLECVPFVLGRTK